VELTGTALPATLEQCAALLLELAPTYGKYVTVQQALITRMISYAHERVDFGFYFGDITAVLETPGATTSLSKDAVLLCAEQIKKESSYGLLVKKFLPKMHMLAHLRTMQARGQWEAVLLALMSDEESAAWMAVHAPVHDDGIEKPFSSNGPTEALHSSDEVSLVRKLNLTSTPSVPVKPLLACHRDAATPAVKALVAHIDTTTAALRTCALSCYTQAMAIDACLARSVRGKPGDTSVPATCIAHISSLLAELNSLGVSETSWKDMSDKPRAMAMALVTLTQHFRGFLLQPLINEEDFEFDEEMDLLDAVTDYYENRGLGKTDVRPAFDPSEVLTEITLLKDEKLNRFCFQRLSTSISDYALRGSADIFGQMDATSVQPGPLKEALSFAQMIHSEALGKPLRDLMGLGSALYDARCQFPISQDEGGVVTVDQRTNKAHASLECLAQIPGHVMDVTDELNVMLDNLDYVKCDAHVKALLTSGHHMGSYFDKLDLYTFDDQRGDETGSSRWVLNASAVNCDALHDSLQDIEEVEHHARDKGQGIAESLLDLRAMLLLLVQLRSCLVREDWAAAGQTLASMTEGALEPIYRSMSLELAPLVNPVRHLGLLVELTSGICEGQATRAGPVGMPDIARISFVRLDHGLHLYEAYVDELQGGDETAQVHVPGFLERVYLEGMVVKSLREFLVLSDYVAFSEAIETAASNEVGKGRVAMTVAEVTRCMAEMQNYTLMVDLVQAIASESLVPQYHYIDMGLAESAPTLQLEAALTAAASNTHSDDTVLAHVLTTTQLVFAHRKTLKEGTLIDEVEELHDDMKVAMSAMDDAVAMRAGDLQDYCVSAGLKETGIAAYVELFAQIVPRVSAEMRWGLKYRDSKRMIDALEAALATSYRDEWIADESAVSALVTSTLEDAVAEAQRLSLDQYSFPTNVALLLEIAQSVLLQRTLLKTGDITALMIEHERLSAAHGGGGLDGEDDWPDQCVQEILTIRDAIAAWDMRTNAVEAVAVAAFEVQSGARDPRMDGVSAVPLQEYVDHVRKCMPKSPTAQKLLGELLETIEPLIWIRNNYCAALETLGYVHADWERIRITADDLSTHLQDMYPPLKDAMTSEVFAWELAAVDRLHYASICSALQEEPMMGKPGAVELGDTRKSLQNLQDMLAKREDSDSIYSSTAQIRTVAHTIKRLRAALLSAHGARLAPNPTSDDIEAVLEKWRELGRAIKNALQSSDFDPDVIEWRIVWADMCLMADEATFQRHKLKLEHSLLGVHACYARKNQNFSERIYSDRAKLLSTTGGAPRTGDLDAIIADETTPYLSTLETSNPTEWMSEVLGLIRCTEAMREIRILVAGQEWTDIETLSHSLPDMMDLQKYHYVARELEMAMLQVTNGRHALALETAIRQWTASANAHSRLSLDVALKSADAADLTDNMLKRLPPLVRSLTSIRDTMGPGTQRHLGASLGTSLEDMLDLSKRVHELEANAAYLSSELLAAVHQSSQVIEQVIAMRAFRQALSEGMASGRPGSMDYSTIDSDTLTSALGGIASLTEVSDELSEMITTAKAVQHMRLMQGGGRWGGVANILEQMESRSYAAGGELKELVAAEVALAHEDVSHRYSMRLMKVSLDAFGTKGIELGNDPDNTLANAGYDYDDGDDENSTPGIGGFQFDNGTAGIVWSRSHDMRKDDGHQKKGRSTSSPNTDPPTKPPKATRGRRFSVLTAKSTSVDFEGMDTKSIEQAIAEVQVAGCRTKESENRLRTCKLVLRLRNALKKLDWHTVRIILQEADEYAHDDPLDPLADVELSAVAWQLDLRKNLLAVQEAMTKGRAIASVKGFSVASIRTEKLTRALQDLKQELDEAQRLTANKKEGGPGGTLVGMRLADGKRFRTQNAQEDVARETLFLDKQRLLIMQDFHMAGKSILKVREWLVSGDYRQAYSFVDSLLQTQLLGKNNELLTYRTMLQRTMDIDENISTIKGIITTGNLDALAAVLNDKYTMECRDLGYFMHGTMEAMALHRHLKVQEEPLLQACVAKDYEAVREHLDSVGQAEMNPVLMTMAREVDAVFDGAEKELCEINMAHAGGVVTDRTHQHELLQLARRFPELRDNESVAVCKQFIRLSNRAAASAYVVNSITLGNAYGAATVSLKYREAFYANPASWERYQLVRFPNFRRPQHFRHAAAAGDVQALAKMDMYVDGVLTHQEGLIHNSLTVLPSELSAVALSTYSRLLLPLEQDLLGQDHGALRKILQLGRRCPSLRDEILLQHIRLIRHNHHDVRRETMWRALSACLHHFPPSRTLEPFLELFVLQTAANAPHFPVPERCLRLLHESVFLYGYGRPICTAFDDSTETMSAWISSSALMPAHYPALDPGLHEHGVDDEDE
jgi:hypothetical protein